MNKQQLASTIFQSANQMRSKIEPNEYKDYILGFMFYKYLSDREVSFLKKEKYKDADIRQINADDAALVKYIQDNIGYFIAYNDLFSTWLEKSGDFDVADVRDALNNFDANIAPVYRKLFEKIFHTLQTGLSKLGDTSARQTKSIRAVLRLIERIPMDGKQDYDVLGFIYEYLISMFAANAGKKAGEFYTPHEVSVLMSEIVAEHLKDREHISIYDPTSGSGSLLINIGTSMRQYLPGESKIKYYAQELKENTYNLTRMNLVMRGISPDNINVRNGDTLEDDWPFFEREENKDTTYNLVKVDAVVSNPPYSQKWDPKDKEFDPRFKNFGVAPKAKADYAFLLHELYHLKSDGIMTIVLPHGVLFRGGEEGKIRENLIENNHIEAIIGLPANIFFGTGIPTIIMVLKRERQNDTDVLIIDASKGYEKAGKHNKLRAMDIRKIADTIRKRHSVEGYAKLVSKEEIRRNEYNLNIPRYVDAAEKEENWDLYAAMLGGIPKEEADACHNYWEALPGLREVLFTEKQDGYLQMCTSELDPLISETPSVKEYLRRYKEAFASLQGDLADGLIKEILDVNIQKMREQVCRDVFKRIEAFTLADPYRAYQILADNWEIIAQDLEMIQEDYDVIFQVEPNMVIKKKDGEEEEVTEVQDGWKGRIMPFELVQRELLHEDLAAILGNEERLAKITEQYGEILQSLDAEEMESDAVNEEKDAFVPKEVKRLCKEALDEIESPEIDALKAYLQCSKKQEKLAYIQKNSQLNWQAIAANKDGTYGAKNVNSRIKELQAAYVFPEESFEAKIKALVELFDEESGLKKLIKEQKAALETKTMETIEQMDEATAEMLLEKKWIVPIVQGIGAIPAEVLAQLKAEMKKLRDKYAETYADIENNIEAVGSEMLGLVSDITGSDMDTVALDELRKILEN